MFDIQRGVSHWDSSAPCSLPSSAAAALAAALWFLDKLATVGYGTLHVLLKKPEGLKPKDVHRAVIPAPHRLWSRGRARHCVHILYLAFNGQQL